MKFFSKHPDCVSYHEPEPIGNGLAMREYLKGNTQKIERIAQEKSKNIQKILAEKKVYVETNHCFIKGFGWYLPKLLPDISIGIIVLSRDKEAIAKSTLRIGTSPIKKFGRDWIITPEKKNPIIPPPGAKRPILTYNFYRIIDRIRISHFKSIIPSYINKHTYNYEMSCLRWYVDETIAMSQEYQKLYPAFTYYFIDTEELNDHTKISLMFEKFGLNITDNMNDIIGTKLIHVDNLLFIQA